MRYIDKCKRHPSVMKIKDMINIDKTFNFDFIAIKNMTKTIYSLDTTKSNPINSIPAKISLITVIYLYPYYIITLIITSLMGFSHLI